jgi:hypothetical protein
MLIKDVLGQDIPAVLWRMVRGGVPCGPQFLILTMRILREVPTEGTAKTLFLTISVLRI